TGIMVNSDFLNGLEVNDAKKKIVEFLAEKGVGQPKTNYKLRDWVFSRQRYWGEPIPLVYCEKCGWIPIPESELPLCLPEVESYEPTDNGESPIANITDWVNTTCPHCGAPAKRETDTMPQWAGSSWYFLRYMDPHCDTALASKEALDYWAPVDWYNGGMEHTTLHLLYSRFWHKFLYDIGVVPTKEPYAKRTSHGMILGENGEKMSKSRGNVINPSDIIDQYGADTMRLYIMYIGDFEKVASWDSQAVKGCKRFLDRIWNLAENADASEEISKKNEAAIHKTIKKVSEDIENMKFNTAIASMMALINDFSSNGVTRGDMKILLKLLSPFAPHMAEELWESFGEKEFLSVSAWPKFDESKTKASEVEIAVQVCGKIKARITIPADISDDEAIRLASEEPKVKEALENGKLVKSIVVKNRLVNLIVK
ncbi:MAG: class I tRNA ligase family protein, partial [Oscillospiraceae bacterium]|nr:class I tRNA ligase family protein [Oscillospiraceae bacterium]